MDVCGDASPQSEGKQPADMPPLWSPLIWLLVAGVLLVVELVQPSFDGLMFGVFAGLVVSVLTALLPQSLSRQGPEIRDQLETVLHLIEKPEHDDLPLPMASSLCNQDIISRCDQLICLAFHDSETLLASCRNAEDMGKVVSLLFFD